MEASVSQGGRAIKGIPVTEWFRPGRGCGQETLSSVPCPLAVRIRNITNVYVTANAHGFTRNAHQEPKPIPILDRRTKKLNSGLRPWLRFSLMHMEARECGGTERHCQPHWLHPRYNPLPCCPHGASVIVLAPFCPGPHCVYTPEWPASHIRTASLIPSHRNLSYRVQKSLMAIVCERLYSPQRALNGLSQ